MGASLALTKKRKTLLAIALICALLISGLTLWWHTRQTVRARDAVATSPKSFTSAVAPDPILADTLNSVINNVTWSTTDSWTAEWAPILAGQNGSALDAAITQDVNQGNYADALYVARIADINNYTSSTLTSQTQTALRQMPMCGSLPATYNGAQTYGDPNPTCFLVYTRYILWSYEYAQQYGLTSKWNATKAFTDFAALYNKPPTHSAYGEMLFCDPRSNWAYSYSSRYYDECAETLSVFLKFAELGVPGALGYADKAWAGVQNHWTGQFYEYTTSIRAVECEVGNFAQVIAEYAQQKGGSQNVANWNRVIQDLNYKLLASGWYSPGWAGAGVMIHAKGVNNDLRLWETMGAMTALQELYQNFTPTMQTSLQNMLEGSGTTPAWQGLWSSSLNVNGRFKGTSSDASPSNDATACAAATLFLDGIVPVTGSLAVAIREEHYNDLRTQFQSSQLQFDYGNHRIRIPVSKGQLTFIYGSTPVSYNFPADGVYDVQFSRDWNQITSVNGQRSGRTVHLFLTADPNQATYARSQSINFTVSVLNQMNPALDSTLTLTATGAGDYYYFDFQRINMTADAINEYSFTWNIPDVAGTYVVEASLVPPQLTVYDALWLKVD